MLLDLHIRNLAVVEEATIELGPGFNVLSGETGAGKSIVVDSLALLAGVRASQDQIRTGAETLSVTGVFQPEGDAWRAILDEAGLVDEEPRENDGEIVIRREISRSGRNRVFVDDRPATLKVVADLAPHLIRIHGQREELGLVDPELQRTWLDRCGAASLERALDRTRDAYEAWKAVADRLDRHSGDERQREERLDYLRFVVNEIDAAGLQAGEEDELRQEREVLRHAEAIQHGLGEAARSLFGDGDGDEEGARAGVSRALAALEAIVAWEPGAAAWVGELEEIEIRLGELEPDLSRRADEVEADPRRLDAVEERLSALERLFRKYGGTSADVLEERERLAAELEELEDDENDRDALEAKAEAALRAYREAAEALSAERRAAGRVLAERVTEHLQDLALERAIFEVDLSPRRLASSPLVVGGEAVDFGPLGYDQVVYRFSPNPGEELRALAKVASGGELSRLYLAVQLASRGDAEATSGGAARATLVFDEVDAGISGAEAAVLGGKIKRLAQGGQVLAVTHLPQVASHADVHFRVKKEVTGGRTRTRVVCLGDDGRVEEVARMLAGSEVTDLSLDHARELIAAGAAVA